MKKQIYLIIILLTIVKKASAETNISLYGSLNNYMGVSFYTNTNGENDGVYDGSPDGTVAGTNSGDTLNPNRHRAYAIGGIITDSNIGIRIDQKIGNFSYGGALGLGIGGTGSAQNDKKTYIDDSYVFFEYSKAGKISFGRNDSTAYLLGVYAKSKGVGNQVYNYNIMNMGYVKKDGQFIIFGEGLGQANSSQVDETSGPVINYISPKIEGVQLGLSYAYTDASDNSYDSECFLQKIDSGTNAYQNGLNFDEVCNMFEAVIKYDNDFEVNKDLKIKLETSVGYKMNYTTTTIGRDNSIIAPDDKDTQENLADNSAEGGMFHKIIAGAKLGFTLKENHKIEVAGSFLYNIEPIGANGEYIGINIDSTSSCSGGGAGGVRPPISCTDNLSNGDIYIESDAYNYAIDLAGYYTYKDKYYAGAYISYTDYYYASNIFTELTMGAVLPGNVDVFGSVLMGFTIDENWQLYNSSEYGFSSSIGILMGTRINF